MSTPPEVIAARKLNQAKYALEDFDDGVADMRKVAYIFLVLAGAMGLSLLLGGVNELHLLVTIFAALGLLYTPRVELLRFNALVVLTVIYLAVIIGEIYFLGLPDLLVPFLNANEWRGLPVLFNEFTPYLYYGLKIASAVYLLRLWWFRSKVRQQPKELLQKISPERWSVLGEK